MTTPTPRGGGPAAGGSGKITREAVLAAALEIIDRDGAEALSMRRLARALDRDPMILYRHAPNKAALLDGVAETVLAQLHIDAARWATSACRRPRGWANTSAPPRPRLPWHGSSRNSRGSSRSPAPASSPGSRRTSPPPPSNCYPEAMERLIDR
jgi:AcrR family transcriptional regulator